MKSHLLALFMIASAFYLPLKAQNKDQTVANGGTTTPINFPGSGCRYAWTNNNPDIGLAASGNGNIAPFIAVNNGNAPVKATITATALANTYAYILNANDNKLTVVEVNTNAVKNTINFAHANAQANPYRIVKNPNASRLYVSLTGDDRIAVINTSTNAQNSVACPNPTDIALTPDDNRLYVVSNDQEKIYCINTNTLSIEKEIPVNDPLFLEVHPNGSYVYVASTSAKSITIISTSTNEIVGTISLSYAPYSITISPDGNTLYCTDGPANKFFTVNTITRSETDVIDIPFHPNNVVMQPDGKTAYVSVFNSNKIVLVKTADNSIITEILLNVAAPRNMSLSADGSSLLVSVFGTTENVLVIDTRTKAIIKKLDAGGQAFALTTIDQFDCSAVPLTYTITVNPSPLAEITVAGNLPAFTTTYGTNSPSSSLTVSGTNTRGSIIITTPPGFEIGTDNMNFGNTITLGSAGTIPVTPVYIRLSGKVPAAVYMGDVVFSSTGTTNVTVTVPASTVAPAPLTIIADNKTKAEGTINPDLTATYIGFVNNETASVLTTSPVLSTIADEFSPVGQYVIDISGATAANYVISHRNGTLTVEPKIKELIIPNAFSPNGDGINDVWIIKNLETYANATLHIYNRNGAKIYSTRNTPWDGNHNGKNLPVGTYFYMITLNDRLKPLLGHVTLIR